MKKGIGPRGLGISPLKKKKHTGKKVKVTTSSGKEIELDTRSSEYKSLQNKKAKKGSEDTSRVFDKGDVNYTGFVKK